MGYYRVAPARSLPQRTDDRPAVPAGLRGSGRSHARQEILGNVKHMKRMRMQKKLAYLVFIPSAVILFSLAWTYFGAFSLGAFLSLAVLLVGMRFILRICFEFHDR
ncbi:hypothetical protein KX729_25750 [Rhizobium sp. XQZ8]|uniref:hypothetical protein n=1 Tax=Rhizobium populisoli TaxID=2859785 RepID=UPI001CA581D4|nr:hypothetical protein [Rhizobium populisoli]MBW6424857.1 hypothetical protein [Rhizobium populisoli]